MHRMKQRRPKFAGKWRPGRPPTKVAAVDDADRRPAAAATEEKSLTHGHGWTTISSSSSNTTNSHMDAKPRNLGGSLPVPNVQDLAARPGDELTPPVLSRYLRDDVDGADANGDAVSSVPVIDLARLLDPSSHGDEESAKLKAACEEWGFFQVINHGVPDAVVADVKADLQAFFRLPLADKRAVAQEPGGIEGYGQAFVVSEDQKLDWADMLFLSTQPPEYRAPRFWPARPATFGDSLARYSAEVQRVAARLLASMAANLGVADAARLARVADAQAVRVNYYPACPHGRGRVHGRGILSF
jgi:hypothetical protein